MTAEASCDATEHATSEQATIDVEACRDAAAIFRALGDPGRMQILTLLLDRELCVTEIAAVVGDSMPAVSQRLKLLRSERVVAQRREGKHVYYSLADDHIAELVTNGLAHAREERLPARVDSDEMTASS